MKKIVCVVLFVLCLLFPSGALGQSFPMAPPFNAWISTHDDVFMLPDYERRGQSIALLRYGDQVRVVECRPDCNSRQAWMRVEPYGIIRAYNLSVNTRPPQAVNESSRPDFVYARVRVDTHSYGALLREGPEYGRFDRGDELLFIRNTISEGMGYMERTDGTFVPTSDLRILTPSTFSGWVNPPDHFGFVTKNSSITLQDGSTTPLIRYTRLPAVQENNRLVRVSGGTVPSADMRVGSSRPRPSSVPRGARWVHVDLATQILTAYNGDDLVFATLVSTGRRRGSTRTGVFQVRRKITYTQMRGGGRRPYSVEGVPWVLYFDDAIALHGAYWHDNFGRVMSHGCVNLSITDAKWVFDFMPTAIPQGWRSIHPQVRADYLNAQLDNMWVVVE